MLPAGRVKSLNDPLPFRFIVQVNDAKAFGMAVFIVSANQIEITDPQHPLA